MKMLVSMLFMGIVSNTAALRPASLLKKERDKSAGKDRLRTWSPPATRISAPGARVTLDEDLRQDYEDDSMDAAMRHFARTQTLQGRMALNAVYLWRRATMAVTHRTPSALKRAFDIMASAILLLVLSPLFALISLLVKLEDGGPVFFAQTRVGKHGRLFKMYKVRSMCIDAEQKLRDLLGENCHREGVTFKLKKDPRITRTGRWLRKFSMDELPQLYNVLIGDMSLVGPRPPVPREVALYSLADRRRLHVTPGITCIWQISGRSEIDFSGQVKLDVKYIENQSLWFDLKILFKTLPAVVSTRGAC